MQRSQAERTQRNQIDSKSRPLQLKRHRLGPLCAQQPNRLAHKPAEGKPHRRRRGSIEPLHIVDRDHDLRLLREREHGASKGRRDHARLGRARRRLLDEQGDRERTPLLDGKLFHYALQPRFD